MEQHQPTPEERRAALSFEIERKFAHLSDVQLIQRIERAPDFGWDDEGWELNRRAEAQGFKWKFGPGDRIELYRPEEGQA